jgi:hypothetical protein
MTSVVMPTRDDFSDEPTLIRYMASQLVRGRLALVLGAGISMPFGLPSWEILIERLFEGKEKPDGDFSLQVLAEYYRRTFHDDDYEGYINAIHRALYKDCEVSLNAMRTNPTLSAVGALVMASRRGNVSNVITFNFDDLLETFLSYHGCVTKSLFDYPHWAEYSDVTVYHPHGMIPYDKEKGYSKSIIFDQLSYSEVIGKENKPWYQLIATIMRSHTSLFIGLSGTDGNLDSMLASVHNEHAALLDRTPYWGLTFSTEDSVVRAGQWEQRGIYYKGTANYEEKLSKFIFSVCQEAVNILH